MEEFRRQLRGFVMPGLEITVVSGGVERTDSVRHGLRAMPAEIDVVLVHDAARALTPPEVFERVIAVVAGGAAGVVPVMPVVDTIKSVMGSDMEEVGATLDRSGLRAVQTPQGFDRAILDLVYSAEATAATDDAGLLEAAGYAVRTVAGDIRAMKVTTPHDLQVAQLFL